MRGQFIGVALLAACAVPASAQQPQTPQQLFEAGAALESKGDWAGAKSAWERLEQAAKGNKRTRAIALVRKGNALFQLGEPDAAVAALRASLIDLPEADASLREDRQQAHLILGRVAETGLDYATAANEYARAEQLAGSPSGKLSALLGLASVQTFTDPSAAAATLNRAGAALREVKVARDVEALFARRHALLLLNNGDFAGAREHAKRAVRLLGGLSTRVNLDDIAARGDTALAMLLGGDPDNAREYMAYTGAGRIPGGFGPGAEMRAPDCGGEAGLKPADVAVVEFSIGDEGQVTLATPIYAAGGPGVALEFARAVREWSWSPEKVKELPAFFRNRARIEMRCSTAFERPSIAKFLEADLAAWLAAKGAPLPAVEGADAALVAGQRAALEAAEAGGADRIAAVPHLFQLAMSSVTTREEINALARRALAIAEANGAPPTARLALDLIVQRSEDVETWGSRRYTRRLEALAAKPEYAGDPRARAAALLLLADALPDGRGRAQLDGVAGEARLAANDPLKVGALIRIASMEQAEGKPEMARAAFEKSGLSADQCALVDKTPKMLSIGAGSNAFPQEAIRWGFEGWVATEYDISADGRVPAARAVLAYPPFVFSPAGEKVFRSARFEKTFRPDGGLGCGAQVSRVRFQMPG